MSKLISKKLRGFRDILPDEARKFHQIEKIIKLVSPQFNLNHIILPILESSSLFKRSIGEHTDIVTKEMYSFDDNTGDNICMTPEGTASCVRAVLENNLIYDRGIKKSRFYYYGPMSDMKDLKKADIGSLLNLELNFEIKTSQKKLI